MSATNELFEGVIHVTRNGTGFFALPDGSGDLIIPPEQLNHAFPYDTVKVSETGMVEDRKTGAAQPFDQVKAAKLVENERQERLKRLSLVLAKPLLGN